MPETPKMEPQDYLLIDFTEIVETNDGEADPLAAAIDNLIWDVIATAAEAEHRRLMATDARYRQFHAQNVLAFTLSLRR